MKNIYRIQAITLLTIILSGCAQNHHNIGNSKFESMSYSKAIVYYEKALAKKENPNALINLAESYRMINNTVKAEETYKKVVVLPGSKFKYPIHKLYLAEALKANKKYEEAAVWFEKYLKDVPADMRAENLLRYCDSISVFMADSFLYTVEALPINTKEANFSPVFYNKGIVFCSERSSGSLKKKHEWTGNAFLDLYYSELSDSGKFAEPIKLNGAINSYYHEGPACFAANETEIYYTRNNIKNNHQKNVAHLKICKAVLVENKWKESEDFPFNSHNYSVGHPTVSADGKTMFFVSDVPGGLGGSDIYISRKVNGKWSNPSNLGKEINTEGNESFPFYYNNGENTYLFFSSNGRPGLGGLDVYRAEIKDTVAQKAIHISAPINSSKDDFGFIIDKEYRQGYFSSNRDSLVDKIYKFKTNEPQFNLEVLVLNTVNKKPLPNTKLALHNTTSNDTMEVFTDKEGKLNVLLDKESEYKLVSKKESHIQDSLLASTLNKRKSETIKDELLLTPLMKVKCLVVDKSTQLPLLNARVDFMSLSTSKSKKVFKTDSSGKVEYEILHGMDYHIQASKDKFFTTSAQLSTMTKFEPEVMEVEIKLEMEGFILNKAVRMDNIYYDYNKWEIRSDAGLELDKLVQLLQDNPEISIELSSHTDSRGADAYNKQLSQKRAEAAAKHIISKGISPKRITAKGYGESKTLNKCKNGVKCSDEEYQYNRRTEFKVVKIVH